MKTLFDDTVTIITPCFCAGEDQNHAEIRAPSIRGEWRWWFRTLGGTREEEADIFGASSGNGKASKVIVRVKMMSEGDRQRIKLGGINDPLTYLLYFVDRSSHGKRLEPEGMLAPDAEFRLQVLAKHGLSLGLQKKAETALWAMLRFGAVGYRARRACGALSAEEISFSDFVASANDISAHNVDVVWLAKNEKPVFYQKWRDTLKELGTILKELRKDGYSAGKRGDSLTPFGNAGNRSQHLDRQASGVRLRPVLLKEGILPAIVYTDAGLDPQCRDPGFYLRGRHVGSGVLEGV